MSKFCATCEDYNETRTVRREEAYSIRGLEVTVPVVVEVCANCGAGFGSDEQDQAILDATYSEYRRQNDLLTPDRIKSIRQRYCLSQKSFATLLGMSEATINRYEKGGLQDQTHDTLIRACENAEFVREQLNRRGDLLTDWQRKQIEGALSGQKNDKAISFEWTSGTDWFSVMDEVSDKTGFRRFDYDRAAAVVIRFCDQVNGVSRTVINKLLFYADFLNFKTSTVSMTGTAYRRAQYGPVPCIYAQLLERMEMDDLLVCREVTHPNGYMGYNYEPGAKVASPSIDFTPHEQTVLACVAEAFRACTAKDISERSHRESAWQNTADGQLISYQEAATLSLDLAET